MKTVFVINPCAGKGEGERLKAKIEETIKNLSADAEIYETKSTGDGERYVKEYCQQNGAARFIACGGDGTFGEVLNGVIETESAQAGVIPVGTGNDFCRNFKGHNFFNKKSSLREKA